MSDPSRLALLTGGSRGIGGALVTALEDVGYRVLEFSRTAPHAGSVSVDLAHPVRARMAIDRALAAIDADVIADLLVISNAGTLEPLGPVASKPPEAMAGNLHVNLVSPILFVAAAVARFQASPARKVIANITAGAAHEGVHGWSLYCAAKMGMEAFVRTLVVEQMRERHPFVVINIDPGVVRTAMHSVAAAASPGDFPAAARFADRLARDALVPPARAAACIVELLTARTVNPGATYHVRGLDGSS